nr:receptor-like protein 54 [Ziziphus jujuba var. spinosa]
MIDLSHNQFQGRLPQMLANCMMLQVLNLGNNRFSDVFPSWLGTLLNLRKHNGNPVFSTLRVFYLSNNSFTGKLPYEFFKNLNAMRVKDVGNSSYLFEGSIPHSIGILQRLHVLNLSNNIFNGKIPSSLGNITELESLDLSNNKLSGQIPPQLAQLTFLEVFEVSHNHLTGPIPQMNQLSTFDVGSYKGNLGLCGNPLPRKCESSVPPSGLEEEQVSKSTLEFHWMTVVPGYVSGLVIGMVIGQFFAPQKHDWFVKTFGQRKQRGEGGRGIRGEIEV